MNDRDATSAFVTGGSRGIGAAIVRRFIEGGLETLVCDVRADDLEPLRDEVGAGVQTLHADVRDVEQIAAWIGERATFPTILVNNAAVAPRHPVLELEQSILLESYEINVGAPVRLSQLFAQRWIDEGQPGCIINIASVNAHRGHPDLLHYNASKAALLSVTRTLALAWGRHGIRVNAVSPGSTWTDIWEEGGFDADERAQYASLNPLNRFATPDEIADVVAFLASPQASFINGADIVADGGLLTVVSS